VNNLICQSTSKFKFDLINFGHITFVCGRVDFACLSVRASDIDVNDHLSGAVAKWGEYATAPNLHYSRATMVRYDSRWADQMLDSFLDP